MIEDLSKENCLFLLVDVQTKLLKIMDDQITRKVCSNIELAILICQKLGVPTLASEQYVKGLGETLPSLRSYFKKEAIFEKTSFSCHDNSELMKYLHEHSKKFIVLSGMETHICVLQTATDFIKQGFRVIVLADAVQSSDKVKWDWGLKTIQQRGAWIVPTETFIFKLMERCDADIFKYWVKVFKEQSNKMASL